MQKSLREQGRPVRRVVAQGEVGSQCASAFGESTSQATVEASPSPGEFARQTPYFGSGVVTYAQRPMKACGGSPGRRKDEALDMFWNVKG